MTDNDISPCPFCGGEGEYDNSDHGPIEWITCRGCGAKGPSKNYNRSGLGSAREAWNTRARGIEAAEAGETA